MIKFDYVHSDEPLTLRRASYSANGRLALLVEGFDTGEAWATLTVNLPEAVLGKDEFCVKNWSENEQIAEAVLALGIFEDTGLRVPTGFVNAPIWRVKDRERFNQIRNVN